MVGVDTTQQKRYLYILIHGHSHGQKHLNLHSPRGVKMIFNHMLDSLCIHKNIYIDIVLCKYILSATTEINVYIAVVVSTSSF